MPVQRERRDSLGRFRHTAIPNSRLPTSPSCHRYSIGRLSAPQIAHLRSSDVGLFDCCAGAIYGPQTVGQTVCCFVESFLRRPETPSNIFRRSMAATTMYAAQRLLSLAPSDPLDRLRIESIALTILCDRLEALAPKALRPVRPSVRCDGRPA